MKCWLIIVGAILGAGAAWAIVEPPSFERYQVILDRKPFGEPPPPAPVVEPPRNPQESFARDLRISMFSDDDADGLRVGIVNDRTQEYFDLGLGEEESGIKLEAADEKQQTAVVSQNGQFDTITMDRGANTPLASSQWQPGQAIPAGGAGGPPSAGQPSGGQLSYAERRKAREERRRQMLAQPPPDPQYTGEELERHLQDYQMEVIRQGLPPLPIPLTEEMDEQLVNEGILPPREDEPPAELPAY